MNKREKSVWKFCAFASQFVLSVYVI
jgi:hypothetical protein